MYRVLTAQEKTSWLVGSGVQTNTQVMAIRISVQLLLESSPYLFLRERGRNDFSHTPCEHHWYPNAVFILGQISREREPPQHYFLLGKQPWSLHF